MTWRRFMVLVAGLPADSAWVWWRKAEADKPLEGEAAVRYFEMI
jgi:hypothetical protein